MSEQAENTPSSEALPVPVEASTFYDRATKLLDHRRTQAETAAMTSGDDIEVAAYLQDYLKTKFDVEGRSMDGKRLNDSEREDSEDVLQTKLAHIKSLDLTSEGTLSAEGKEIVDNFRAMTREVVEDVGVEGEDPGFDHLEPGRREAEITKYQKLAGLLGETTITGAGVTESPLVEAAKLGVDESELKHFATLLGSRNSPLEQRHLLNTLIRRKGLETDAGNLLKLTRNYQKETIKNTENGPLLHYHQTSMDNLDSILQEGALISHDERKKRGEQLKSSGARPDVVQMTRDKYDSAGNVVEQGLQESSNNLIAGGNLAFVFDESVMDEADYDSIDVYPSLPTISLDKLRAVVVNDEENIPKVRDSLAKNGLANTRLVLRSDWLKGYRSRDGVAATLN